MLYGEGTKIKLFRFYDSDSSIGTKNRERIEIEVNLFLEEHERSIIDIQLQGCIIMVVYRDSY